MAAFLTPGLEIRNRNETDQEFFDRLPELLTWMTFFAPTMSPTTTMVGLIAPSASRLPQVRLLGRSAAGRAKRCSAGAGRTTLRARVAGCVTHPRYGCNFGMPQAGRQAASVSRIDWTPLRLTVHLDHAAFGLEYIDVATKIVQLVERGH